MRLPHVVDLGSVTINPNSKRIAVAVIERGRQVLIGQRPEGVPLAGYWEFPGGKVEPDETYEAAVVRECLEETGFEVEIVDEFTPVEHTYQHDVVAIRFFRCRVRNGDAVGEPHGAFQWVDRPSLVDYQFPDANAALIKELVV